MATITKKGTEINRGKITAQIDNTNFFWFPSFGYYLTTEKDRKEALDRINDAMDVLLTTKQYIEKEL